MAHCETSQKRFKAAEHWDALARHHEVEASLARSMAAEHWEAHARHHEVEASLAHSRASGARQRMLRSR